MVLALNRSWVLPSLKAAGGIGAPEPRFFVSGVVVETGISESFISALTASGRDKL
jgi:hypothetical protein